MIAAIYHRIGNLGRRLHIWSLMDWGYNHAFDRWWDKAQRGSHDESPSQDRRAGTP